MAFKITTITVYVAVDEDGEEGILATSKPVPGFSLAILPLVCADEKRAAAMYPIAKQICEHDKKEFRVLRFSAMEDVTEEIIKKYEKI